MGGDCYLCVWTLMLMVNICAVFQVSTAAWGQKNRPLWASLTAMSASLVTTATMALQCPHLVLPELSWTPQELATSPTACSVAQVSMTERLNRIIQVGGLCISLAGSCFCGMAPAAICSCQPYFRQSRTNLHLFRRYLRS
jgi:hypothetical protein